MKAFNVLCAAARIGAFGIGLTGCNGLLGDSEGRVVGIIDEAGTSIDALVVPDTVHAGIPFSITVSTFGSSCLHPDGVTAHVLAATASVTPYDAVPTAGIACPADLRAFPRAVTLAFQTPGTATVQLHGRGMVTPRITLEETVVVAP